MLGRTHVKAVVIDLGVNDILRNQGEVDPVTVTDGLREMVRRAHARGLRVVGATLMPFGGRRGYSRSRDAVRRAVNAEIRAGKVYDAVADFDEALRDPYDPRRLRADYDSGSHLHPSDKGYRRMAEVFELGVSEGRLRSCRVRSISAAAALWLVAPTWRSRTMSQPRAPYGALHWPETDRLRASADAAARPCAPGAVPGAPPGAPCVPRGAARMR